MAKTEIPPLKLAADANDKESLMYIGERRMDPIPLEKGNVFHSLPPMLNKAMTENQSLAALFVPLSQAGKALREQERSRK